MNKFDPYSMCIKCGMVNHHLCNYQPGTKINPEVIERTCKRCGYEWDEKPLDVEEIKKVKSQLTTSIGMEKGSDGTIC